MGKIRLCPFSRRMDLFKDDVFCWSVQRSPPGNMPPQGAILRGAIAIRMSFTQQSKQGGRLQSWIAFELFHHPGPVFREGIGAGLPRMGSLQGGGQCSSLFVFAGGTLAHASTCRCLFLRHPFSSFGHIQFDLTIVFHRTPPSLFFDGAMLGHLRSLVEGNGPFCVRSGAAKEPDGLSAQIAQTCPQWCR